MKLTTSDLSELADAAISAAITAGQMVSRSRPSDVQRKTGTDSAAAQVVTDVDRRSEDIIVEALAPSVERFGFGLLTEERDDDRSRLTADHFWCVDPLDGTLPFIEGSHGYAVSIALVERGGTPVVGVVYDPVEATVMHAIAGVGAFHDRRPWPIETRPRAEVLSVFADRSFVTRADHQAVLDGLGRIAHEMGLDGVRLDVNNGAVMNACAVLTDPPACYFKFPGPSGGGSVWDFAATACIFHEVGAVATDIHGGPLDLNRADALDMAHCGVLFATDDPLARRIRTLHQRTTRAAPPATESP